VKALIHTGRENGMDLGVLQAVEAANERQKHVLVDKITTRFGQDLTGLTFALWGLAFKPNTDDMREAPSRVIVAELARRGAAIRAYDPVAMEEAARVLEGTAGLVFAKSQSDALEGADALVIATEWKEFTKVDLSELRKVMHTPLIFDGRNILAPETVRAAGFRYTSIGRS